MRTVFSQWLSLTQGNNPANVESSELKGIDEFACGATTEQIDLFPEASYK